MPLAAFGVLMLPQFAHATIPFFGPIIPAAYNVCPASWGLVMTVINNIIELLITIAIVFVAPLTLAYAGFLYVVNPLSPSNIAKARGVLTSTVVGIVVALAGWMIVDAVMAALYNPPSGGSWSTWSSLVTSGGIDPCLSQAGALGTLNQTGVPTPGLQVVTPSTSTNEQAIRTQFTQAGIAVNNSPCPVGSSGRGCTNVGGMQSATVAQVIAIKTACGSSCQVIVTGGTEPGHASGTYSHGNGYKVDLGLNPTLNAFLEKLPLTGQRGGDAGGPIRSDTCGNEYVKEASHWDIKIPLRTCSF